MADLRWARNDAFDPAGRRVASVVWCFDPTPLPIVQDGGTGPGFFAPRWHWEAFVSYDGRFEHVLVDDEPGRWAKKHQAKAAAEAAHRAWRTRRDT